MPPKRKAAAAKAGGKKAKKGEAAGPATMKDVASALKAEDKKSGGKKIHSVDKMCHLSNAGAQGESGMNSLKPQPDLAAAAKDFEKKYQDKTKNKWADRAKFTPVPGKYTPIEMAYENEVDAPMPSKRKEAAAKAGGKKAKKGEAAGPATMKDVASALKAEDTKSRGKKIHSVDKMCHLSNAYAQIADDYDCMLNQTNIGFNNNKYYIIQVLQCCGTHYTWNRWGRVGESGTNSLKAHPDLAAAAKDFEKKYRDKTKNKWADRAKFTPVPGKYTLIEMAYEDEVDAPVPLIVGKPGHKVAESALDKTTQALIKLIFDNDMFNECMKKFDIDVKKMPLGKLSKGQIAKGFDVLDEIEKEIDANPTAKLNQLSSTFYTVIPHNFGRKIPPPIKDIETLRSKMDMLLVLGDIEVAQSLQKEKDKRMEAGGDKAPNPLDMNYDLLNCQLELMDKLGSEYMMLDKYTKETSGGWRSPKIKSIWKVNRDGESSRFKVHDKLGNRKLLWHGTNVAVVAAILKGGLRIMPHSGGSVGSGIYFASENSKSADYVGTVGSMGIMFLNEVVLGKEKHVFTNQFHLKAAPTGFDSVLAVGQTEPNPKRNQTFKIDGKDVVVPQGKPINVKTASHSHFSQSEYLIYKESQSRIRYLLLMDF